jgi:hypothetical protein
VLPPLCYWYENQKRVAENDISKTSKTTWENWHVINPFASRKLMKLTNTDRT